MEYARRFKFLVCVPSFSDTDLEGARLHGDRARLAHRSDLAVDDAQAHAQARQPQREREARGTGADDQHIDIGRYVAHISAACISLLM